MRAGSCLKRCAAGLRTDFIIKAISRSKMPRFSPIARLREVRRVWIHRIVDHDGNSENEGGIEAWLRLGRGCGMSRDELKQNTPAATRGPFRGGCLCEFCPSQAVAGRNCFVADRTLCPRSDGNAAGRIREILSMDRPQRSRLFPSPGHPGPARFRRSARDNTGTLQFT